MLPGTDQDARGHEASETSHDRLRVASDLAAYLSVGQGTPSAPYGRAQDQGPTPCAPDREGLEITMARSGAESACVSLISVARAASAGRPG